MSSLNEGAAAIGVYHSLVANLVWPERSKKYQSLRKRLCRAEGRWEGVGLLLIEI